MIPQTTPFWNGLNVGDSLPEMVFPLTVYRLVMAAGANRDFNAIHHNDEVAKASGAPGMYANTLFLQGMWERAIRRVIGPAGVIRRQSGFQMRIFNTPGDTVRVKGQVERKWEEDGACWIEFKVWSENRQGISVGPGTIVATMPRSA